MKQLLVISLLAFCICSAQAQTFDEWFRQKETQKEYLVQQIAALQAYSGTLWQGYAIVRQGLSAVHHHKMGDLGLHQDFFSSLRRVNPTIAQTANVTDIIAWQAAIRRDFGNVTEALYQSGQLTPAELDYIDQVRAKALENCAWDMESLWQVLTADELELRDNERLRLLEEVHQRMLSTYRFTRSFLREAQSLALQRAKEQSAVEALQKLHGLF
ncbi:hypothetical protein ACSX1A_11215 [Pontibacter sp. MBLB2868]|uniref:hypothetical protein n=1 Tax=Pontibacter sp. MBLB2868 TaxID=3451555 RepID=UPI003F7546DE